MRTFYSSVVTGLVILILTAACVKTGKHLRLAARQGDRVYLPCLGDDVIVVWKIRDFTYPVDRLPKWVHADVNGLVVHNVIEKAGGFYGCYAYNNVTYTLKEISVIFLDVQASKNNYLMENSPILNGTQQMNNEQEMFLVASENNVLYIPCKPIVGTNQVVVWRIDGLIYLDTRLPPTHMQHFGGIIVLNASADFLGTTYECYIYTNYELKKLFTVFVTLIVDTSIPQFGIEDPGYRIDTYMVVRDISLQPDYKRFSFTIKECADCSCAQAIYHVQALKPGLFIPPEWEQPTNRTVKIPSFVYQDENVVTEVFSTRANYFLCSNLSYVFRVEPDVVTNEQCALVGNKSCIQLDDYLKKNSFLLVSWPLGPHSDFDCTCPVILSSSIDPNAPSFENCYCYDETDYQVRLHESELCWENLTQTLNDTKVLLVETLQRSNSITTTRSIKSLRRIIAQGPDPLPPNVTKIANTTTYCVDAKSAAEWSPVANIEVIAYDITFDIVLNKTLPVRDFCETDNFIESCLPLKYTVTAYTLCTQSPSTTFTGHSLRSGKVCDCLNKKVNLTTNITDIEEKSISVRVDMTCCHLWTYDINLSNLFIQAKSTNHTQTVPLRVACAEGSTEVKIVGLTPGTEYVISIIWISPSTGKPECTITTPEVIFTDNLNDLTISIYIGISAGSSLVIVLITVTLIMIIVIVRVRKMQGHKGYIDATLPQIQN